MPNDRAQRGTVTTGFGHRQGCPPILGEHELWAAEIQDLATISLIPFDRGRDGGEKIPVPCADPRSVLIFLDSRDIDEKRNVRNVAEVKRRVRIFPAP
jgi:hypothetical protein